MFKIMAGVAAIGSIALGGTALAAAKAPVATPPAAVVAPAVVVAPEAVAPEAPGASVSGVVDTNTIQNENGADDATEVAGQAETEKPGSDGPGGHADEPGNPTADHQFDGQE